MKLLGEDSVEVLQTLENNSIDSIVTDPPYGLSFMGNSWDYDVPSVALWQEVFRVLKPGGHLVSFAGSRTYHRMAVAIEDAGFEIRDQIMWVYGSGFPKSLNIGKAVDKLENGKQEKRGDGERVTTNAMGSGLKNRCNKCGKPFFSANACKCPKPTYDNDWEGWGTALKPSHEPIVLARKPLSEKTVAENVLKWGTGGINIDGCRVGTEGGGTNCNNRDDKNNCKGHPGSNGSLGGGLMRHSDNTVSGRFPANFIHDGSQQVLELFPKMKTGKVASHSTKGIWGSSADTSYNDPNGGGSAARFFYCAKASKAERSKDNNHPTVKPVKLMSYLCKLITPPGGVVLDPFMGSGSTGVAALQEAFDFIGIEREQEYLEIAKARIGATDE